MNYLFFDCETNGLPKDYKASYTEVDNWPRVISLAWMLTDANFKVLNESHHLVKPDGWQMPTEKFWIDAGFTHEKSLAEGLTIDFIMEDFMHHIYQADALVAHNINFDHRIVWAEVIRSGRTPKSGMHKICTMMSSTNYCKIPKAKGGGFKWPKLQELHNNLFGKQFDGAHDALADIRATHACFVELVKLGVIKLPTINLNQAIPL